MRHDRVNCSVLYSASSHCALVLILPLPLPVHKQVPENGRLFTDIRQYRYVALSTPGYPLFFIKCQAANLDGVPVWRVLGARRIQERSMRRQPRLALVRVETLDQRHLVWRLTTEVVPLVRRIIAHAERGTLPVRVYVPGRHKVLLRVERAPVRDGERVVRDGVPYGAPHIDDPHTALEQAIRVSGRVLPHPCKSCGIRLVDVHARLEDKVSTTGHEW